MRAELDTTRQDRDRWHAHAERLGTTVDRLTITVAELGDRVVEQRALQSGAEEPAKVRYPYATAAAVVAILEALRGVHHAGVGA